MPINLEGLEFETAEGTWCVVYIGEPREDLQNNRIEYYLRFKWIDPHDPENKATPERRLRLYVFAESLIANDAEEKLINALALWVDADEESEARFDYDSRYLLKPKAR